MKRLLLRLWLVCTLFFCFMPNALAENLSVVETLSFNQMPPFEQDGSWPSIGEYAAKIGYETARDWVTGEYPVDVLKVGDILDGLHPDAFRLSDLAALDGLSIVRYPTGGRFAAGLALEVGAFLRGLAPGAIARCSRGIITGRWTQRRA